MPAVGAGVLTRPPGFQICSRQTVGAALAAARHFLRCILAGGPRASPTHRGWTFWENGKGDGLASVRPLRKEGTASVSAVGAAHRAARERPDVLIGPYEKNAALPVFAVSLSRT